MRIKYLIAAAITSIAFSCTQAPQPQSQETVKVVTWKASDVTTTSATLSGRYSGVTTEVRDHGFYWGTSESSLTGQLGLNSGTASASDFTATLSSLEPGKTYFFKAYVTVMDSTSGKYVDVEGGVQSFTTRGSDDTPQDNPDDNPQDNPDDNPQDNPDDNPQDDPQDDPQSVSGLQYLGGYEIPAINLQSTDACSGSGQEKYGSTKYYNYLTTNENQMVVTHTYSYNGRQYRNYTILVDKTRKASLWNAFVMHKEAYPDNGIGRAGSFSSNWDPGIPASWQQESSSNGYSRGHMVASNYRQACTDANKQTFYATNQALQQQNGFNGAIWEKLENKVVTSAPTGRDTLYVTVGLLFEDGVSLPSFSVPCPSHFYKLLMKCSFDSSGNMTAAKGCAYLFENISHGNSSKDFDNANYRTSIDALEERTGFNFFANVPAEFQDAAESSSNPIW